MWTLSLVSIAILAIVIVLLAVREHSAKRKVLEPPAQPEITWEHAKALYHNKLISLDELCIFYEQHRSEFQKKEKGIS
jgi:hypothetical protein